MHFFEKVMLANGATEKLTMDKSGTNKSAIDQVIDDKKIILVVRQIKYLNHISSLLTR